MRASTRSIVLAACSFFLGVTGLIAVPSPASATVTKLCVGYTGCSRAGMSSSGYSSASGTMYWQMYSGHNCTNYAAYRMVHSGMPNKRPWTGSGNATNWGAAMSSITDRTPTVGSIAWWRAGVYPAGSAGHVAYVERVVSADEIIVSQDSWGGDFSWARITKASSGWPSGFVHFNDIRVESITRPVVTGTPRVGSVLSSTTGAWSPNDVTTTYQWRAGRDEIPGATSSTLRLTQDLVGRRIKVRVTASEPGYPSRTVGSVATEPVTGGNLASTSLPTVAGDPAVGSTLTAAPGTWDPAPDSTTYQWLANGTPIAGADQPQLTPDRPLLGKSLSVTVTAHKEGYVDTSATSAPTAPVVRGTLAVTEPALTGTPQPGQTLTLDLGTATPEAQTRVRWVRGGTIVRGATGTTYQVTDADLGSDIWARVRWTRAGYTKVWTRTPATGRVRALPEVDVSMQSDKGRLTISTSVSVKGTDPAPAVLVRSDGEKLAETPLTDGRATTVVSGLTAGVHEVSVVLPRTATTARTVVTKRVRIR